MRRNQLLAGIMTAMTVVMPVANVYADSAKDHEVQIAASIEEKKSDIDKAAVLQNSVKMTADLRSSRWKKHHVQSHKS